MICEPYHAGMLRQAIAIQRKVLLADGVGGNTTAWEVVPGAVTRAYISGSPSGERLQAMRVSSGNSYRMATRWFAGASAAYRIIWKGSEYAVLGVVDPDGRGRWLEWSITDGRAT